MKIAFFVFLILSIVFRKSESPIMVLVDFMTWLLFAIVLITL